MAITARRFEGQVALVTGASRGIGRATAVRHESEGAHVVINHFRGAGVKYPGAAEDAAVRKMIRDVVAEFGSLDVLVNNAGICPMVEFLDITEDLWDRVHDLNLRAVFFASQEAARLMMERGTRGRIVCNSFVCQLVQRLRFFRSLVYLTLPPRD